MSKAFSRLCSIRKSFDEILENFDKQDLRGLSAVRNFIAHDYDSIDDEIIEDVLRYNFPKIKNVVLEILENA